MYSLVTIINEEVTKAKRINKKIKHKSLLMFCWVKKL